MRKTIVLLFPFLINAQQLKVIDSLTNAPIGFVKIISHDKLYLTDSLGIYTFENIPKEDLTILASGYEKKITKITSNLITLTPKIIPIEEVTISNKKLDISKIIGYKNGKQTSLIAENIEYAVEIINHQNTLCKVDQIEIPFKKSKNKKGYLLIDFYENNNGEVGELLNYKNYTIPINTITKNTILTIEDHIFLNKNESIYIAMTWVENINAKSEIYSNVLTFFSLPKGSSGKMYARRTYNDWHHSTLIEDKTTISSFIPAFRIHAKCEK